MRAPANILILILLSMQGGMVGYAAAQPGGLEELLTLMEKAAEQTPGAPEISTEYVRGRERSIQVPFIERSSVNLVKTEIRNRPPTAISVDGRLNESLWENAARSSGFWCSLENRPPTDQTDVRIACDAHYLYFGFRLFDSRPDEIEATKTVRDTGLGFNDSITVELDTFFNRRDISRFSLNPLGTQTDEIAGGRSGKVEWKGDWFGAAARGENGWTAEFAIPFAILNYQPGDTIFGLNFKRYQSRTKEYSWWADITPQSRPEEMGQLQGLNLPATAASAPKHWTFMPFVLAGKNIPDKKGNIQDDLVTGGMDIRYQPRPDLTGMISLNPDFSQVEQAVTDISFSYTEKAVEDNRPFFTEGKDYFGGEDEYFYSIRAVDFDFGAKGFGRTGRTQFGILATGAPDDRYDGVGRLLYELGETHAAATMVTTTRQADFDNALVLAQFNGRETGGFEYAIDAAMTDTQANETTAPLEGRGTHFKGSLGWKGDYWYLNSQADQYDADYFPALALLDEDLSGTRAASVTAGCYREQSKYVWRVVDGYAGFNYRETEGSELQRRKWFGGLSVEFENQMRTSAYVEEGPYRPVTDQRGEFEDFTNEDRYYSVAVDFNTRSSVFSFGTQVDWGELADEDYQHGSVYAWLKPVSEVFLKASYEITDYFGTDQQVVMNGSWEISTEDSLGARYICYNSDYGSDEYLRLAYGRKVRKGMDVFVVYDKDPYRAGQYSLKLVYSF